MKKTLSLVLTLFLTVGLASAQSSGSEAKIKATGNNNDVTVEQVRGADNNASIWVSGNQNVVSEYQRGDRNQVLLEVAGGSNDAIRSKQMGDDNAIYVNFRGARPAPVFQSNDVDKNDFLFLQVGKENIFGGAVAGDGNSGQFKQYGTGNTLLGDTDLDGDGVDRYDAQGLMIEGHRNTLRGLQQGRLNTGKIMATGNGNHLRFQQKGQQNYGEILVTGDGNTARVTQGQ
ncbi:hypothetical protein [Salisaeta longa]|uniref:hypothetical protein n=1 Tax=Salisaeta longa TaxID=503170 RepID=UPI0003B466F9|nr:hypothetical protein [Salisaeta longa]